MQRLLGEDMRHTIRVRAALTLFFACLAMAASCQVNTWVYKAHMTDVRTQHASTTGLDGRVYVIGGTAPYISGAWSTAATYDPQSDSWSAIADMPSPRFNPAA